MCPVLLNSSVLALSTTGNVQGDVPLSEALLVDICSI